MINSSALRLTDMTILEFLLSAVMVGVYLLHDLGLAKLSPKATIIGGNLLGGLIFGAGGRSSAIALGRLSARWERAAGTPFGAFWA
jgi:hypothetical protein